MIYKLCIYNLSLPLPPIPPPPPLATSSLFTPPPPPHNVLCWCINSAILLQRTSFHSLTISRFIILYIVYIMWCIFFCTNRFWQMPLVNEMKTETQTKAARWASLNLKPSGFAWWGNSSYLNGNDFDSTESILSGGWNRVWVILYKDTNLVVYKKQSDSSPMGTINLFVSICYPSIFTPLGKVATLDVSIIAFLLC